MAYVVVGAVGSVENEGGGPGAAPETGPPSPADAARPSPDLVHA